MIPFPLFILGLASGIYCYTKFNAAQNRSSCLNIKTESYNLLWNITTTYKVETALNRGADPNARNERGTPALCLAVKLNPDAIPPLLEAGADPNVRDEHGTPALCLAAKCNPVAIAPLLKAGADPNAMDPNGDTAIISLAFRSFFDYLEIIDDLLSAGADINTRDQKGNTILHRLIRQDKCIDLKALISRGLDINAQNQKGETALFLSAMGARYYIEEMCEFGANPNIQDVTGRTALFCCSKNQINSLLSCYINPCICDYTGATALAYNKDPYVKQTLEQIGVTKYPPKENTDKWELSCLKNILHKNFEEKGIGSVDYKYIENYYKSAPEKYRKELFDELAQMKDMLYNIWKKTCASYIKTKDINFIKTMLDLGVDPDVEIDFPSGPQIADYSHSIRAIEAAYIYEQYDIFKYLVDHGCSTKDCLPNNSQTQRLKEMAHRGVNSNSDSNSVKFNCITYLSHEPLHNLPEYNRRLLFLRNNPFRESTYAVLDMCERLIQLGADANLCTYNKIRSRWDWKD